MRLWSVHPRYFDRQALTACWRESLLAQAVLSGRTSGYIGHPQLERFRDHSSPLDAISAFLRGIADEAEARGYRFDRAKILRVETPLEPVQVTTGQVSFEWAHLLAKLETRSPAIAAKWQELRRPQLHPLFTMVEGPIASWERPKA